MYWIHTSKTEKKATVEQEFRKENFPFLSTLQMKMMWDWGIRMRKKKKKTNNKY